MEKRRIGIFTVSSEMLRSTPLNELAKIMHGVFVWHTEANFADDTLTYHATCEEFDLIEEGRVTPRYDLNVITENGSFMRREFCRQKPQSN